MPRAEQIKNCPKVKSKVLWMKLKASVAKSEGVSVLDMSWYPL